MLKKFLSWVLIIQHLNIYVLHAAAGDIRIEYEKDSVVTQKVIPPTLHLKVFQEDEGGVYQNIIDHQFERDGFGYKLKEIKQPEGFVLETSKLNILLKSTVLGNKFSIQFDAEGKVTLVGLDNTDKHIQLSTFGDIFSSMSIKSAALTLAGKSFTSIKKLNIQTLNLNLGQNDGTGLFTVAPESLFVIGKSAHINGGRLENQGRILGRNGSFLDLHGNNFTNKNIGQNGKSIFKTNLSWEGNFSVLNAGLFENQTLVAAEKTQPNGTFMLTAATVFNAANARMVGHDGSFEINSTWLKNFGSIASDKIILDVGSKIENRGQISSRILHLKTENLDNFNKISISQEGCIAGSHINNMALGSIHSDGILKINGRRSTHTTVNTSSKHSDVNGPAKLLEPTRAKETHKERKELFGNLRNEGSITSSSIDFAIDTLNNLSEINAVKSIGFDIGSTLTNSQNASIATKGDLKIINQGITHNKGVMVGKNFVDIQSDKFENESVIQSDKKVKIFTAGNDGNYDFNNSGLIKSATIYIDSHKGRNSGVGTLGGLLATRQLQLITRKSFDNGGHIVGGKLVEILGEGSFENSGVIDETDRVVSRAKGFDTRKDSVISTNSSLDIGHLSRVMNNHGVLKSHGSLDVSSKYAVNNIGLMEGVKSLVIAAGQIINDGVLYSTAGFLKINTKSGVNRGFIKAENDLGFTVADSFVFEQKLGFEREQVKSNSGGVSISGDGKVTNNSFLKASGDIHLNTNFINSGQIESVTGDVTSKTTGKIFVNNAASQILAAKKITIENTQGFTNLGATQGENVAVTALKGFLNKGSIYATKGTAVFLIGQGTNSGQLKGAAKLDFSVSDKFENEGWLLSSSVVDIHGTGHLINKNSGVIGGDNKEDTKSLIVRDLNLTNEGNVRATKIEIKDLKNTLVNAASGIIHSLESLVISNVPSLENAGHLYGDKALSVKTENLLNSGVMLSSEGAAEIVAGRGNNTSSGKITAKNDVKLSLAGEFTNEGLIASEQKLFLEGKGRLINKNILQGKKGVHGSMHYLANDGEISSPHTIDFTGGSLDNGASGNINSGGSFTAKNLTSLKNLGEIFSQADMNINAAHLQNDKNILSAAGDIRLTLGTGVNSSAGKIGAGKNLVLLSSGNLSNDGLLYGDKGVNGNCAALYNKGSVLSSAGDVDLTLVRGSNDNLIQGRLVILRLQDHFENRKKIHANQNFTADGQGHFYNLTNQAEVLSGGTMNLNIKNVTNQNLFNAAGNLSISANTTITNSAAAKMVSGSHIEAHAGSKIGGAGTISSLGTAKFNHVNFHNTGKIDVVNGVSFPNCVSLTTTAGSRLISYKDVVFFPVLRKLSNGGDFSSHKELKLLGLDGFTNTGTVESMDRLTITLNSNSTNVGKLLGKKGILFKAKEGKNFSNQGFMESEDNITVKAFDIKNSGTIKGDKGILLGGTHAVTHEKNGKLQSAGGIVKLRSEHTAVLGSITAKGAEVFSSKQAYKEQGAKLILEDGLKIESNLGWDIKGVKSYEGNVSVDGPILNRDGLHVHGNFIWRSPVELKNDHSLIIDGHMDLFTPGLLSNSSKMVAGKGSKLSALGFINNKTGTFFSGAATEFNMKQSVANLGFMEMHGNIRFNVGGSLTNLPGGRFEQKTKSGEKGLVELFAGQNVINKSAKMLFQGYVHVRGLAFVNELVNAQVNPHAPEKPLEFKDVTREAPVETSVFSAGRANFEVDLLKNRGSTITARDLLTFKGVRIENITRDYMEKGQKLTKVGMKPGEKKGGGKVKRIKRKVKGKNRRHPPTPVFEWVAYENAHDHSVAGIFSANRMLLTVGKQTIEVPKSASQPIFRNGSIINTGDVRSYSMGVNTADIINHDNVYGCKLIKIAAVHQLLKELFDPSGFNERDLDPHAVQMYKANKPQSWLSNEEYKAQLLAGNNGTNSSDINVFMAELQRMQKNMFKGRPVDISFNNLRKVVPQFMSVPEGVLDIRDFSAASLQGPSPHIAVVSDNRRVFDGAFKRHVDSVIQAEMIVDYLISAIGYATVFKGVYSPELQSGILDALGYINGMEQQGLKPKKQAENWDNLTPQQKMAQQERVFVAPEDLKQFKSASTVYQLIHVLGEQVLTPLIILPQATREQFQSHIGATIAAQLMDLKANNLTNLRGEITAGVLLAKVNESLKNLSGKIKAGVAAAQAGSVLNETLVETEKSFNRTVEKFDKQAEIITTEGALTVEAKKILSNLGGLLEGYQDLGIKSGEDVVYGSASIKSDVVENVKNGTRHTLTEKHQSSTQRSVTGNLTAEHGGTAHIKGSNFEAKKGDVDLTAKKVQEDNTHDISQVETNTKKGGGIKGKKTEVSQASESKLNPNNFIANRKKGEVRIQATGDINRAVSNTSARKEVNTSKTGKVAFNAGRSTTSSHTQKNASNIARMKSQDKGHHHETVQLSKKDVDEFKVEAAKGVTVEVNKGEISKDPVYTWIKELEKDPTVMWNTIAEEHKSWNKKTQCLSPALMVVVSVVAACCTGGAGLGWGAALATEVGITSTAGANMVAAVLSTAMTKATASLYANKGNIGKVAKDLTSKNAAKDFVMSAASAGVGGNGVFGSMEPGFAKVLADNAFRSFTSASLSMAIHGTKPKDALLDAVRSSISSSIGEIGAGAVGGWKYDGDINSVTHKIAHAMVGAASGAIQSKNWETGALSGAAGAACAEICAEALSGFAKNAANARIDEEMQQGKRVSGKRADEIHREEARKIAEISKVLTATAALITGLDVQGAVNAAANALENNYAQYGYQAFMGGMAAWAAYDIYDTYKTEGPEAALAKAGVEVATAVVGGAVVKVGYKVAGKIAPTAGEAWAAYVATKPNLIAVVQKANHLAGKVSDGAEKVAKYIGESPVGKAISKAEQAAADLKDKVLGRGKPVAPVNAEAQAAGEELFVFGGSSANKVFDKTIEWAAPTGTKQTYKVYQRNDIDWGMVRTSGPEKYRGKTNSEAAKAGFSPQLNDGSFATLHHIGQNSKGPLVEASTKHHRFGAPGFKALHGQFGANKKNPEFPVKHDSKWKTDTEQYWKKRGNGKDEK